jgi:hypothetical protein
MILVKISTIGVWMNEISDEFFSIRLSLLSDFMAIKLVL